MFEITLEDARLFKNSIDAIGGIIEEGIFEISEKGIHLRAMDPSQIAMVDFTMPQAAFSGYKVESPASVGLKLSDLSKVLARTRGAEKLRMALEENRLVLEFKGESRRTFKLPLIDAGAPPAREPKVEFDATVKLGGSYLKDALHDAALISSHAVLEASDKKFAIEAHGDAGDLQAESEKGAAQLQDIELKAPARAMFPLQYLEDMAKGAASDAQITLGLKTNAPVRMMYKIGDAALVYYLAPRIESE